MVNAVKEEKKHKNRKEDIINVARQLFIVKGYNKTTINEIIQEMDIAKGTFYHYFKSKEEVLDCIVEEQIENLTRKAAEVKSMDSLTLPEKLIGIIKSQRLESVEEQQIFDEIQKPENALMYQKFRNKLIQTISPELAEIVIEGNRQGVFAAEYPLEYMEILLSATVVLTDRDWDCNIDGNIIQALFRSLELMLKTKKGTFSFVANNMF